MNAVGFVLISRRQIARLAHVALRWVNRLGSPSMIRAPHQRKRINLSRCRNRDECIKRGSNNLLLIVWIGWSTCCVAERVIDKHCPRCLPCLHDIESTSEAYGWDACVFQVSGNQTHGLMANWSHRDQKNSINILRLEALFDGRNEFFADAPLRIDTAHAGIDVMGEFTNMAVGL